MWAWKDVGTQGAPTRSFSRDNLGIRGRRVPLGEVRSTRLHRTSWWPSQCLNYEFLNRCKELVCRVKHPNPQRRWKDEEYWVSILPWSRGSYLDIRKYHRGNSSPIGILLHLDVISALLPDIVAAVHRMEREDTREPEQKSQVEVLRGWEDADGK